MPIDLAIGKILETGFLGAIIIILSAALAFMYRENQKLNNARLQDAIQNRDILIKPLQKIQDTADSIVKGMERSNDLLIKLFPNAKE